MRLPGPQGRLLAPLLAAATLLAGCRASAPVPARTGAQVGVASYYSDALAGRATASGAPYDPRAATCAHRTLPFGTLVEIEVLDTGARARCRINDRGPFVRGRVIDVSRAVARRLGLVRRGVAKVRVRVLGRR